MKVPVTQIDFAVLCSNWHHNPYSTLAFPKCSCRHRAETPTSGFRAAECRGSVRMCENLVCISCTEGQSASWLTSQICQSRHLLVAFLSLVATMMGIPFGKKSPKSELHEFFQLHPGNPVFDIQPKSNPPAEPLFLCTLTCPAIGGPQGLPEQTFTGQGRNKKTAEQYASEKALEFLRQRGLMAPAIVQMPEQKLPLDLQKQLASTQMVPVSLKLRGFCLVQSSIH